MTTHQTPSSVLRGATQLLAGVPYLLDYRPERSLVLIGSVVDRTRLGREAKLRLPVSVLLRVDLPEPHLVDALVAQLVPPLARAARDRGDDDCADPVMLVHLFLYDADDELCTALLQACQEQLPAADAELYSVLVVRDGRYRSILAHDCPPGCEATDHQLPTDWQPEPDPSSVPAVADFVLEGRNPARSRADVVALVRRRDERMADLTGVALGVLDLDLCRLDEVEAAAALGRWVVAGKEPSHRERAAIVRTLEDRWVRDLVLGRWLPDLFPLTDLELDPFDRQLMAALPPLPEPGGEAVSRMLHLASVVPLPLTAPVLTLTGCLAWRHGEGTIANEAVDLALEVDPDYRMAQLLQQALVHGFSPWALKRAAAA